MRANLFSCIQLLKSDVLSSDELYWPLGHPTLYYLDESFHLNIPIDIRRPILALCCGRVLGQNGRGQNGTDKMVWTKWYTDKMVSDKMVWTN